MHNVYNINDRRIILIRCFEPSHQQQLVQLRFEIDSYSNFCTFNHNKRAFTVVENI